MSIETYLNDYLLGEIFVLLPGDISNLSKVCKSFKRAIVVHPILRHVQEIGTGKKLCEFATRANKLALIKYVINHNLPTGDCCIIAARSGNLKLLEYLFPITTEIEHRFYHDEMTGSEIDFDSSNDDEEYEVAYNAACETEYRKRKDECKKCKRHTEKCCSAAIKNDNLMCLKYLYNSMKNLIPLSTQLWVKLFNKTCKHRSFNCYKYLRERTNSAEYGIDNLISAFGIDFIKYYFDTFKRFPKDSILLSAQCHRVDCIEYLRDNGYEMSKAEIINGTRSVGTKILELYYSDTDTIPSAFYQIVIDNTDFQLLNYLLKHNCEITDDIVNYAFHKSMEKKRINQFSECCSLNGDIMYIIKAFNDAGYKFNKNNIKWTIEDNNVFGFEYLHKKGIKIFPEMIDRIVKIGNIDFIRYAFGNGIIKDNASIECSEVFCRDNNYRGLKYLIVTERDLSDECIYIAITKGNTKLVAYLYENGYDWENEKLDELADSFEVPMSTGLLTFLIQHGYITKGAAKLVIDLDSAYLLDILRINEIELDEELCIYAAERKKLECFKLIMEIGYGLSSDKFFQIARDSHIDPDDTTFQAMRAIVMSMEIKENPKLKAKITECDYDDWIKHIPNTENITEEYKVDLDEEMKQFVFGVDKTLKMNDVTPMVRKYLHISAYCHGLTSESFGDDIIISKPSNWTLQLRTIRKQDILYHNAQRRMSYNE